MTSTYRSHSPLLGSKTRPPLYLSRLAFPPLPLPFPPPPPSSSSSKSSLTLGAVFLPHVLSGQMYFSRWNSCNRMYSFRSARPPFKVLFLKTTPTKPLGKSANRIRRESRGHGEEDGTPILDKWDPVFPLLSRPSRKFTRSTGNSKLDPKLKPKFEIRRPTRRSPRGSSTVW